MNGEMKDHLCSSLDPYLEGCLSKDEHASFESHLERCGACRRDLKKQKRLDEILEKAAGRLPPAPVVLRRRVERSILARERRARAGIVALVAAASVVAALAIRQAEFTERPASTIRVEMNSPPAARVSFSPEAGVIGVPIETENQKMTIVFVYPQIHGPKTVSEQDEKGE